MNRRTSTETSIKSPSAANIHHLGKSPSRWAHWQVRFLMAAYSMVLRAAALVGRRPRTLPPTGYDILLTGTFFSDNWVRSHLLPLAASSRCDRVRMVATTRVPLMSKVEGVYPPAWLITCAGELGARLLYFVWVALRTRPHIVGGFHLLVNGLMAPLLGRLIGAKSLYFCVGGPVEVLDGGIWGGNRLFSRLSAPDAVVEQRLLEAVGACDLVITMGTRAITFFRERGVDTAFHVVSGGIDPDRFRPSPGVPEFDLVITCRLVQVKRVDLFLRAVARLVRDIPQLRAVIVGDGPLRPSLQALASELDINNHVVFAGEQTAVEGWLRRSRVFVLTSDSEGLSLALMEAMMSGLPAVVSAVGDLGDLVEHGVNGCLVAERTPEAFAAALRPLLTDARLLERFAAAAARVGQRNNPEAVTSRWDAILAALGGSQPGRYGASRALSRKNLWEHAPLPVKAIVGSLATVLPAQAILGRRFSRELKAVRASQWWTEEQIRAYQTSELRRLCTDAQERTFFYRQAFRRAGFDPRDIKRPEDLVALPTIDRSTLRDHLADMAARPIPSPRVDYVSTGGSSGEPLRFYIDSNRSSVE